MPLGTIYISPQALVDLLKGGEPSESVRIVSDGLPADAVFRRMRYSQWEGLIQILVESPSIESFAGEAIPRLPDPQFRKVRGGRGTEE